MRPGFMRDHIWTRRHLSDYLDRELDALGRQRLERHTDLCPKCHRLVATLVQTIEALRALHEAPAGPPLSLSDSVIACLRQESG